MKDVVDPELGINVVDLGLVYGVHVDDENVATLDMTLTSAACPLTDVIEDQTRQALTTGPGGGLVKRLPDQLGVAAAVGPRQDHRRGPRPAARARLQRLRPSRTRENAGPGHRSGVSVGGMALIPPLLLSAALAAGSAGGAAPATLIGAGDIADCDSSGDSRTLAILQRFPGTVFTLGDNAYPNGSRADFAQCYEPTWGKVKDRTRPVVATTTTPARTPHPTSTTSILVGGRPAGQGLLLVRGRRLACGRAQQQLRVRAGRLRPGLRPAAMAARRPRRRCGKCTVAMTHHPQFSSASSHPPTNGPAAGADALRRRNGTARVRA